MTHTHIIEMARHFHEHRCWQRLSMWKREGEYTGTGLGWLARNGKTGITNGWLAASGQWLAPKVPLMLPMPPVNPDPPNLWTMKTIRYYSVSLRKSSRFKIPYKESQYVTVDEFPIIHHNQIWYLHLEIGILLR